MEMGRLPRVKDDNQLFCLSIDFYRMKAGWFHKNFQLELQGLGAYTLGFLGRAYTIE